MVKIQFKGFTRMVHNPLTVRKSTSSRSKIFSRRSHGIYSLQSSRSPTPRGSSFNHTDFYSMVNGRNMSGVSPRLSNFGNLGYDEESGSNISKTNTAYHAPPNNEIFSHVTGSKKKVNGGDDGKDLRVFVWSSSVSRVSEGGIHVFRSDDYGNELIGVAYHHKGIEKRGGVVLHKFSCKMLY